MVMTTTCASCDNFSAPGDECVSFELFGEAICGHCLRMFTGAASDAGRCLVILDEEWQEIPSLGGHRSIANA